MRWAPLPSARLLPIVSRGAYRDTGYHSSVANSTPGTVAGIGSACAVPGRAYIPASSFPDSIAPPHWLGTCWYFTVTTDASEPVVPGSDCLPTPATENYERRKDPSSPCTRFFFLAQFRPGDHLCRFSAHWVIGRREDIVVYGQVVECVWLFRYDGVHSGWCSEGD